MKIKAIILSLMLISGCAYSSSEYKNNQIDFPELILTEQSDSSLLFSYITTKGTKKIIFPVMEYNTTYVEVLTRKPNTNNILNQERLNYMLGDFRSESFISNTSLLQIILKKDNSLDNYVLELSFDDKNQDFILQHIYQLSYINGCGHELDFIKDISSELNTRKLQSIDFKSFHEQLFSTRIHNGYKILPDILLNKYQQLLSKLNNQLEITESLVFTEPSCPVDEYINSLYFYEDNVELTNNLAFFFQEAGYQEESISLLKKILAIYPNRVVAYLNIADSYFSLGNTEKAVSFYKKYAELMINKNLQKKIPQRVINRIQ